MQNRITVYTFDQDWQSVTGTFNNAYNVEDRRFNGDILTDGSNSTQGKITRYFTKGGLYKVKLIYSKGSNFGKGDFGLDSSTTNIFSQVDMYNAGTVLNNVRETFLEISRGFHTVVITANGKNTSSSNYYLEIQALEFDLIQEYPVYKDDQSPRTMPTKAFQRPSLQFATLASDYTTTTTANDVSTGVGVTVSSPHTDKIKVKLAAIISNSLINDGVTLKIYRSTSAIPAQGSASGGSDTAVYSTTITEVVAAEQVGIPAEFVDSSLVPGQTYYYYITIKAVTAGTAKIQGGTNQTTLLAEPV